MSTRVVKSNTPEHVAKNKKRSQPKAVFETERLRVFRTRGVIPTDMNVERDVYFAFRTDEDRPMITVNAVLWDRQNDWFVDWLEVGSEYRREGFATEFLDGLVEFLDDDLDLSAGSDDGRAFLESYCPDRDQ